MDRGSAVATRLAQRARAHDAQVETAMGRASLVVAHSLHPIQLQKNFLHYCLRNLPVLVFPLLLVIRRVRCKLDAERQKLRVEVGCNLVQHSSTELESLNTSTDLNNLLDFIVGVSVSFDD